MTNINQCIRVLISFSLYIYNQQIKFALWSKTSIHTQDKTAFVTNASHHILAKCAHKEKTQFFFGRRFSLKTDFYTRFEMILSWKEDEFTFRQRMSFDLYVCLWCLGNCRITINSMNKFRIYQTKCFFHIEPLRKLILKMFRFLATTTISIKIEKALVRTIISHSEGPRLNLKQFFLCLCH